MNFYSHAEFIHNKANATLQFVKGQSQYFDHDVVKILYYSLVRSNLEFASANSSPYTTAQRKFVECTQKQFVMVLNGDHVKRSVNNYIHRPYTER